MAGRSRHSQRRKHAADRPRTRESKLQSALQAKRRHPAIISCKSSSCPCCPPACRDRRRARRRTAQRFMSLLARELPNEARVEMVRISRDRAGPDRNRANAGKVDHRHLRGDRGPADPAGRSSDPDRASAGDGFGIMYISGRERSLRAATEFVGALGVNVGAGMILREGTRALLKFFPGLGQRGLRDGRRRRNLCDRAGGHRLFPGRRFTERRPPDLPGEPKKARPAANLPRSRKFEAAP